MTNAAMDRDTRQVGVFIGGHSANDANPHSPGAVDLVRRWLLCSRSSQLPRLSLFASKVVIPFFGKGLASSQLERHDAHQRDANPSGASVQFVKHLVERFVDKKNIEQLSKIFGLFRQEHGAARGLAVRAQEFG